LAQFRSLGLERGDMEAKAPRAADWAELGQSPYLKPQALSVDLYEVKQAGFEGLLRSPRLAGLRELRCHRLDTFDCRFLPSVPAAQELLVLDLALEGYGRNINWLADCPGLARLRALAFSTCKRLAKDLPRLLASPHFGANLTALTLIDCDVPEDQI